MEFKGVFMNNLQVFSAVYLIMACLSPVIGYYILRLYRKGALNGIFFAISLCVAFWSMGFSIVIVAQDAKTAEVWTRVSAVGYTIVYSLVVHFILVLTEHKKLMSKKWIYPIIYLPAAVFFCLLVVSPSVADAHYNFVLRENGWVSENGIKLIDIMFQFYFVGAGLIGFALLIAWQIKNKAHEIKIQANLVLASLVIAFGVGSFTDIFGKQIFGIAIPKMAPIFFLLPIAAIYYCIDRYHLMKAPNVHSAELILSDENRIKVFRMAILGIISGGISVYMVEYLLWKMIPTGFSIFSSVLLAMLGLVLIYVQHTKKGVAFLEILLFMTNIIIIPTLMLNTSKFAGMGVWAFPIMLVLCSLVFNSDIMLVSSSLSLVLSQVYLLGVNTENEINADYRTYITRLVVIAFVVVAAYYVHLIYIKRLRENASQARLQKLISDIYASFSIVTKENARDRIKIILGKIAAFFETDSVVAHSSEVVFESLIGTQSFSMDKEVFSDDEISNLIRYWEDFCFDNVDSCITGASHEEADYGNVRVPGGFYIPIYDKDKSVAFIFVRNPSHDKKWSDQHIAALPLVSHIISEALEKLNSEMRVQHMAYYDGLTQLPNRQLFHDRAEQAIHLARRNNSCLGVIFVDLDGFKAVNDTIGHEGGDKLIAEIAKKLDGSLRKIDTVARFGGDEYLILINNVTTDDDITTVADKLIHLFQKPVIINRQEIFITASMGISVFPADGDNIQALLKHADIAMYKAKENGRNQYAFCSENMKETVKYRVALSNSLYRALDRREFMVYYQPQIDLESGKISGMEALIRWKHPDFGMVPPPQFIPLAEQTGLIHSIGAWVLETACLQLIELEKLGFEGLIMAVNLSVIQLRSNGLMQEIKNIFERTGVDPSRIELEITESATTTEPDYIISMLNELKTLGIILSIDDFGTEYSSLSRLKSLPVDKLKMDIQFVRGIEKGEKDRAIANVIINLAKTISLKLIAEGVETEPQLEFLRNRSCDEIQGYYFYKPMPSDDLKKALEAEKKQASMST